jgi:WD40 repeat protein
LYELLTGRPPHVADTVTKTLRLVLETEVISAALLNPNIPQDLETICGKCLEKNPARRYLSAKDLGEDLGRFLNHEPIRARRISGLGRLERWCRRKPALALACGISVALLLVVLTGSPLALVRINRARKQAEAARSQIQQQLYRALLQQARATVLSRELGHRVRALDAIAEAAAITNAPELRREALAALTLPDLRFQKEIHYSPGDDARALDANFTRDAVCRADGQIDIRSVASGKTIFTLAGVTNLIGRIIKWSGDGRFIAIKRDQDGAGPNGDLEVWDVSTANPVLYMQRQVAGNAFSFHPNRPWIVSGSNNGQVNIWELEGGKIVSQFEVPGAPLSLRFGPDGRKLAAALITPRGETLITILDAMSGESAMKQTSSADVTFLEWDPRGRWIAIVDDGGNVRLIDSVTGQTRLLGKHKTAAVTAAFSPDGAYLVTGGWEQEMICWDLRTGERAFTISLNSFNLQFSSDGASCAVQTRFGCQLFEFERELAYRHVSEELHGGMLREAAFSPDSRWLAFTDLSGLTLRDVSSANPALFTLGPADHDVVFANDEELFASRKGAHFHWRVHPANTEGSPPTLDQLPLGEAQAATSFYPLSNSLVLTSGKGSGVLSLDQGLTQEIKWAPTLDGINRVSQDGRWLGIYAPF